VLRPFFFGRYRFLGAAGKTVRAACLQRERTSSKQQNFRVAAGTVEIFAVAVIL